MRRPAVLTLIALLLATATGAEQFQPRRRGGAAAQFRMATPESFDGKFRFCRGLFGGGGGFRRGSAWGVDYPRADVNLSIRLSELTRTDVAFDAAREPEHLVVSLAVGGRLLGHRGLADLGE